MLLLLQAWGLLGAEKNIANYVSWLKRNPTKSYSRAVSSNLGPVSGHIPTHWGMSCFAHKVIREHSKLQPIRCHVSFFLYLFISTDTLHVSGDYSTHHQEHITVYTASGIVSCSVRVKWIDSKFTYKISGSPDDGRRNRLTHVECL